MNNERELCTGRIEQTTDFPLSEEIDLNIEREYAQALRLFSHELIAIEMMQFAERPFRLQSDIVREFMERLAQTEYEPMSDGMAYHFTERLSEAGYLERIVFRVPDKKRLLIAYKCTEKGTQLGIPLAADAINTICRSKTVLRKVLGRSSIRFGTQAENDTPLRRADTLVRVYDKPIAMQELKKKPPDWKNIAKLRDRMVKPLVHEKVIHFVLPDGTVSDDENLLKAEKPTIYFTKGGVTYQEVLDANPGYKRVKEHTSDGIPIYFIRRHILDAAEKVRQGEKPVSVAAIVQAIPSYASAGFRKKEDLLRHVPDVGNRLINIGYFSDRIVTGPADYTLILSETGVSIVEGFLLPAKEKIRAYYHGLPVPYEKAIDIANSLPDYFLQVADIVSPYITVYRFRSEEYKDQPDQILKLIQSTPLSSQELSTRTGIYINRIFDIVTKLVMGGKIYYYADEKPRIFRDAESIRHVIFSNLRTNPEGLTINGLSDLLGIEEDQMEAILLNEQNKNAFIRFSNGGRSVIHWIWYRLNQLEKITNRSGLPVSLRLKNGVWEVAGIDGIYEPIGSDDVLEKEFLQEQLVKYGGGKVSVTYSIQGAIEDYEIRFGNMYSVTDPEQFALSKDHILYFREKKDLNRTEIFIVDNQIIDNTQTQYGKKFDKTLDAITGKIQPENHTVYTYMHEAIPREEYFNDKGEVEIQNVLNAVEQGDVAARSILFETITPGISRFVNYLLSSPDIVDDVTQDILIKINRVILYKHFESVKGFRQWYNRITYNAAMDVIHHKGIVTRHEYLGEDYNDLFVDVTESRVGLNFPQFESMEPILRNILSPGQFIVLELRVYGISYAEMAKAFGDQDVTRVQKLFKQARYIIKKWFRENPEVLDNYF